MVEESLSSKQVAHGLRLKAVELVSCSNFGNWISTDLWMSIFLKTLLISVYPTVVFAVHKEMFILVSLFSCDLTML